MEAVAMNNMTIKERIADVPVKEFAKEKIEKLKEIKVKEVIKTKTEQIKTTTTSYFDITKKFFKENPLLSLFLASVIVFASIPLISVLSILITVSLILFSISFVVLSTLAFISGALLFVYYTVFILATDTYKKSVVALENKGNTPSYKIVIDCFSKTIKEYIYAVTSTFTKIMNYLKLKLILLTTNVKSVDFGKIKSSVMEKVKKADRRPSCNPNETEKEE